MMFEYLTSVVDTMHERDKETEAIFNIISPFSIIGNVILPNFTTEEIQCALVKAKGTSTGKIKTKCKDEKKKYKVGYI